MVPFERFARVGRDVTIDPSARFFRPEAVAIGDRVRIDAFCLVSAGEDGIVLGDNVHLGAGACLFGGGGRIVLEDFSGLSGRVSVYTASDDYSDGFLTNPTVPERFRKVRRGPVTLRRHAIVGAGSVIMPDVELGLGAAVGALAFVSRDVEPFHVVAGNPARKVGLRDRRLLDLEAEYRREVRGEAG